MKQNMRNQDKNGQNPPAAKKGSTLLGVIAAMLFIGIVTASMVKNTGSQASAAIGYSNMLTMSSTVRSGIVATETYFQKNGDDAQLLELLKLDTVPIFGNTKGKNKKEIANSKQFFSSRIVRAGFGSNPFAVFEIGAGKNKNGKSGKKALVYYGSIENLRRVKEGNAPYDSENAFNSASSMDHIKAPFNVQKGGNVVIEGNVDEWQRASYFSGEVYFGGSVKFPGNHEHIFEKNVYFEGPVNIPIPNNPNHQMFRGGVGFNSDLNVSGGDALNIGGHFAINGNIKSSEPSFKVTGNPDSTFFYTENLPVQTSERPNMPEEHTLQNFPVTVQTRTSQSMPEYSVVTLPNYFNVPITGCTACSQSPCYGNDNCYYMTNANSNQSNILRIRTTYWDYNNLIMTAACPLPHKHSKCCQFEASFQPGGVNSNWVQNTNYSDMQQCVWTCDNGTITCATHPNGHIRISDKNQSGGDYCYNGVCDPTNDNNRINGYSETNKQYVNSNEYPNSDKYPNAVLSALEMKPIEERREKQQIDLQKNLYTTENTNKILSMDDVFGKSQNISGDDFVSKLNTKYDEMEKAGLLYEEHLVIKITNGAQISNAPNTVFNKKVMFIVEGGTFEAQNGFYKSGSDASTLIYVDQGNSPRVNMKIEGDFRGYICIDSLNNNQNHILDFGSSGTTTITGAIHNLAKNAKLEVRGQGVTFNFDRTVLGAFSPLACKEPNPDDCKTGGDVNTSYLDVTESRVNLSRASGYYFY